MSELAQSSFDYGALPVDLAVSLKLHADRYIAVRNRAAYEMGKEIFEAQQELANHDKTQGQFGRWVEVLGITRQTGYDLITLYQGVGSDVVKLFDNKKLSQTVAVMLLRSSESVVEKALEKAESGEKVSVEWVKREKELEKALADEKQRSEEWRQQSFKERDEKREAQHQIDLLKAAEKPEPEIIEKEVIPADYETTKQQAVTLKAQTDALQKQLADLQKQQTKLVNDQVNFKLKERQGELDKLEADKKAIEEVVSRKKAYLDSLDSEVKRIETHQSVINGVRLELINLAAFLHDLEPMNDKETINKWIALSDMCDEAKSAIRLVFDSNAKLKQVA